MYFCLEGISINGDFQLGSNGLDCICSGNTFQGSWYLGIFKPLCAYKVASFFLVGA